MTTSIVCPRSGVILTILFFVGAFLSPSLAQGTGPCNCQPNEYCFDGSIVVCLACSPACNGCSGPSNQECSHCAVGYYNLNNVCRECPDGQFGSGCNGTCHCLDNKFCNTVNGECVGKCAKGYAPPPFCQTECNDGFYGLDCLELCHCANGSVCDKMSGFCPDNLCHPDWFSAACSKRLPMLSTNPTVIVDSCDHFFVTWLAWDADNDFGDPEVPVGEYRLYIKATNDSSGLQETKPWTLETTLPHDPDVNVTSYEYNVSTSALRQDWFYQFRVDVHGTDDGKTLTQASRGLPSSPPVEVPCATTTVPPPVTVPIFAGADVLTSMSVKLDSTSAAAGDDVMVTWTLDPQFLWFSWNLTLTYTMVGIGNCAAVPDGNVTSVSVDQSQTNYSIQGLDPWTRYEVSLHAQGLGAASVANDTETATIITSEQPPSGNVSQLIVSRQPTSVSLRWTTVPCQQRGGLLKHFQVQVRNATGGLIGNYVTNVTSLRVENLAPFTQYKAEIRYVNRAGEGPFSPFQVFTTTQGVPGAVNIELLIATASTVTVKVTPPDPVNGVLEEYNIMYSTTATFTQSEALTFNSSNLTSDPVISRLKPFTIYYFKARAKTGGGYGPYGNTSYARTLQAKPHAPESLLQTEANLTCVTVTWLIPEQAAIPVTGYTLKMVNTRTGQGVTATLEANATSYERCDLDPGSTYNLSLTSRSGAGSGQPVSLVVSTEQLDPPSPPSPTLVDVSPTFASVEIEPLTLTPGVEVTYQLQVERVGLGTGKKRRKRVAGLPGYVTAQLAGPEVTERLLFVIGDGQTYGGFLNRPLDPGNTYNIFYVALSTFRGVTKSNHSRMDSPIQTPFPTTPQPPTTVPSPTTEAQTEGPSPEDDNGILIGVILGLLLLIILIVVAIILILWWRRRQRMRMETFLGQKRPPYFELDEGLKKKVGGDEGEDDDEEDELKNERYWNQVTSLRESRYIVVGRECLPDEQLVPVSTQMPQPGAAKITFRKEFKSLPKDPQDSPSSPSSSSTIQDQQQRQTTKRKTRSSRNTSTEKARRYRDRNRFPHILPYDHTLVKLRPDSSSRCPYINASLMSGYRAPGAYIAAQSPFDERTAVDFWRLIQQQRIKTVLLLANGVEDSIVKCTQYWPREGQMRLGQFYLELREEAVYADFALREVTVRESGQQDAQIVRLFDFTSWPDHGVPQDPIPFLELRYKVRQYHGDEPGPILVHCGTGVGRTGVFIAVDSLIQQYVTEGRVSVVSFVRKMRKERPLMVRTLKQYRFIYRCLLEEFQAGETMADATTIRDKYRLWTSKNSKTGHSFLRDQFQLLHRLTDGPTKAQCKTARHPDNVKRNRYPDVVPSDLYRPELRTPAKLNNSDYINAIFVDGYRRKNQFIVTQTPLHTTLLDFWRLVYDHHVTTVVMVDRFQHEDSTCAQYWPEQVTVKQWEPFFVETTAAYQQENVMIRNLKVRNTLSPSEPPLMVRQFQFNAWAHNSFVPASKTMALDLIDMALEYQASSERPYSPIVVHCEDGATHSGLLVCLALICERIEEEQEVDVYHVIKHVKRRRPQIIPDYEQLRFCYRTLWDYITQRMPGATFTTMGSTMGGNSLQQASLTLTPGSNYNVTSRMDSTLC